MGAKLQECVILWVEKDEWNVLTFDGVISEGHGGSTTATKYPVATGFMVSDHTIRQNRTIDLQGVISNISLNAMTQRISAEDVFVYMSTEISSANDSLPAPPPWEDVTKHGRAKFDNDRLSDFASESSWMPDIAGNILDALSAEVSHEKVQSAYKIIQHLNAEGILVHVATIRDMSYNCVITGYRTSAEASNAHSLNVSLTLEQLNVVTTDGSGVISSQLMDTEGSFLMLAILGAMTLLSSGIFSAGFSLHDDDDDEEKDELEEFLKLPHMFVPFSSRQAVRFDYKGVSYTLGRVRWNRAANAFVTSLSWKHPKTGKTEHVKGLVLRSGVDILRPYNTGLPSLVMVNIADATEDPMRSEDIRLMAVDSYHLLTERKQ